MAEFSGINFKVIGDTQEAVTSIKKLNSAVSALSKINIKNLGLASVAKEIKTFSRALNHLNTEKVDALAKSLNAIKGVGSLFGKIGDDPAKYAQGFQMLNTYMRELSQIDFSNLSSAAQNLRDLANAARLFRGSRVRESTREATDAANEYRSTLGDLVNSFGRGLGGIASGIGRGFVSVAQTAGRALGFLAGAVARIGAIGASSLFKALVYPLQAAVKPIKNVVSGLKTMTRQLGRIAMYRLFRTIIKGITQALKDGTKNLYMWSKAAGGSFAASMDSAASSMLYFKNSVAAAWSPLMSVLGPALDAIIDKVVAAINALNQLIALLSGAKGWTRATRKAKDYEDAVGGAGGAAKDALRYLAPFDELNVLPDDKGGGGGGGGAEEWEDAFEEMTDFEAGIAEFAANIRKAIEESDWKGLGELLGGKVNELIDYLEEKDVFGKAGRKVGSFINAWFTTKYWTLDAIKFEQIGSMIADFLNNMMANVDFEYIGRGTVQWKTKIFDIIIGVLTNVNWYLIGDTIGSLIRGAFNEAAEWLGSKDFGAITTSILTGISTAVRGARTDDVMSSILSFLRTALRSVSDALGSATSWMATVEWEALGNNMMSGLWSVITTLTSSDAGPAILAFLRQAIISASKLLNGVSDWISDADWGTIAEDMFQGLWDAITALPVEEVSGSILKFLGAVVKAVIKGLGTLLIDVADFLTNPDTWVLVEAWFKDLPLKFAQVGINVINSLAQPIVDGINDLLEKLRGSGLGQWLQAHGWNLDPIEFQMIPNIPEELLTENYDGAKAALEEASQENPVGLSSDFRDVAGGAGGAYKELQEALEGESESNPVKVKWKIAGAPSGETPSAEDLFGNGGFEIPVGFKLDWPDDYHPSVDAEVNFTSLKLNSDGSIHIPGSMPWGNVRAWFKETYKKSDGSLSTGFSMPWGNVYAWYASTYKKPDGSLSTGYGTPFSDVIAFMKLYRVASNLADSNGYLVINSHARILATNTEQTRAQGGVFSAGRWHDIPQYAGGTSRVHGSLFIAGEAGPEIVGHIGGRTEVLNRSQIASAIYSAVVSAMSSLSFNMPVPVLQGDGASNEDALYRAFRRALDETDFSPDEIDLDGAVVYQKMLQRNRQNTRMTGVNAFATA